MLGIHLSVSDISLIHSDGDADVDVVSRALTAANSCPVTLLGEDTDLLVLLLWHYNPSLHHPVHLYFSSSKTAVDINKSKKLLTQRKKSPYSELIWFPFFPHFPAFRLNMERYSISSHIQSECGKIREMRTRITPNTYSFYAMSVMA